MAVIVETALLVVNLLARRRAPTDEDVAVVELTVGAEPRLVARDRVFVTAVEGEVVTPCVVIALCGRVEEVGDEVDIGGDRSEAAVVYVLVGRSAARTDAADDTVVASRCVGSLGHCLLERDLAVVPVVGQLVPSGDVSPVVNVVVKGRNESLLLESHARRLLAVSVGNDLPGLSELRRRQISLVEELGHIGVEVVFAIANALTGVEGQIDLDELAREGTVGFRVVDNLDRLDEVHLGAVRARDGGHLLDAEKYNREGI